MCWNFGVGAGLHCANLMSSIVEEPGMAPVDFDASTDVFLFRGVPVPRSLAHDGRDLGSDVANVCVPIARDAGIFAIFYADVIANIIAGIDASLAAVLGAGPAVRSALAFHAAPSPFYLNPPLPLLRARLFLLCVKLRLRSPHADVTFCTSRLPVITRTSFGHRISDQGCGAAGVAAHAIPSGIFHDWQCSGRGCVTSTRTGRHLHLVVTARRGRWGRRGLRRVFLPPRSLLVKVAVATSSLHLTHRRWPHCGLRCRRHRLSSLCNLPRGHHVGLGRCPRRIGPLWHPRRRQSCWLP
mmetsp:Transcript_41171/g.113530  ORF Transcript_41171/g.113530 Transcript_41171/m.113530 type:complete len:297 (-) Transcript_41171:1892-2782(-)